MKVFMFCFLTFITLLVGFSDSLRYQLYIPDNETQFGQVLVSPQCQVHKAARWDKIHNNCH